LCKKQATAVHKFARQENLTSIVHTKEGVFYEKESPHIIRAKKWAESLHTKNKICANKVSNIDQLIKNSELIWKITLSHHD
jgi:hypothetical protein